MYVFDEFFASGKEESISPFLTQKSKRWGRHLSLKIAFLSAFFLLSAFIASFFSMDLSYLLLVFVYFFSGTPALLGCIEDLRQFQINIDTLMTFAAFLSVLIGSPMEGALLLVLFELSGAIEEFVSKKTKHTLVDLHHLSPRFTCVVSSDGTIYEKSVKEITKDTLLLIKAGEVVPLDGIVVKGSSFVNLVHLTGESQPISKTEGETVLAGSYNLDGALTIRVVKTSQDSTLSRIIHLITEAQEAKPKLERFLDRFGKWYAILIITLCFLFALMLPLFFSLPYLGDEGSIYRALSFLIAASPCALIIATPTAYLSAISSCAKKGILLKGGAVLDALSSCKTVAFDKTGTLTTGKLHCSEFKNLSLNSSVSTEEALGIAYALEQNATHPIAEAIIQAAKEKGIRPFPLLSFHSVPGFGLEGSCILGGQTVNVTIGNRRFIEQKAPLLIKNTSLHAVCTFLLIKESLFVFYFQDTLRPQTIPLIKALKDTKWLTPMMLTGDHAEIADTIAKEVGIDKVHADLKPEDKLHHVSELSQKEGLIMVGDGINDAPALARATVGISLGKIGSATAIDASDIVFLNDDLMLLYWVLKKSKKTLQIIKQNITLALIVIVFATTPALLGFIPLWLAVLLHEGGTVLVGLNSLRLLFKK
ncbi:MAG: putative cadmium/zinc-transporting ATPase HMA1,chloroplastic [Chlamydiota bacterium]|jgi:heavy metal translocating P-type ATPase